MELVTVIIPTHNRVSLVQKAIASALNQTWKNIEILVINDASTDDTGTELKKLQNNNNSIRVIKNNISMGGAEARNQGIKNANGKFIAFLDDDDTWEPTKISKQMFLLESNPDCSVVSCWYYFRSSIPFIKQVYKPKNIFDERPILNKNSLGGASNYLIKKQYLDDIGGFDPSLKGGQDWDLLIRLFYKGPLLVYEEPLVNYFAHAGTRITTNTHSIYSGRRQMYFKYLKKMDVQTKDYFLAELLFRRMKIESRLRWFNFFRMRQIFRLVNFSDAFIYILRYIKWLLKI